MFRVIEKRWDVHEFFVEAESEEQVHDLLCGEGPPELVDAAEEARAQAEFCSDDDEILLIEEAKR